MKCAAAVPQRLRRCIPTGAQQNEHRHGDDEQRHQPKLDTRTHSDPRSREPAGGERHELSDSERIYIGAWTRIVIRRATPEEQGAPTP